MSNMKTVPGLQWLPIGLYLYPVIAGFTVTSETATVLGKYSTSWFVLHLVNLCLFPAFYWISKKQHLFGKCAVLLLICSITVFTLAKVQMRALAGIELIWPLIRLAAGFSLFTIGVEFFEANRKHSMLPVFLVSVGLIAASATDVVAWGAARFSSKPASKSSERAPALPFTINDEALGLASNSENQTSVISEIPAADAIEPAPVMGSTLAPANLGVPTTDTKPAKANTNEISGTVTPVTASTTVANGISPQVVPGCYVRLNSGFQLYANYGDPRLFDLADILIVGDSVVDGTGVVAKDTFACQLEVILSERSPQATVHVLSFPGGSLSAYASLLELLPDPVRLERIVVGFNYDDFPSDPSAFTINKFVQFSLAKGSYTQRALARMLMGLSSQNPDQFYADQIRNYDRNNPTFQRRWDDVRVQLLRLRALASKHSAQPPILIIFPLMISFENYPVEEAQAALAELAVQVGFQPLNVFSIMKAKHLDGLENREGTHFNSIVHHIIAEQLARQLD